MGESESIRQTRQTRRLGTSINSDARQVGGAAEAHSEHDWISAEMRAAEAAVQALCSEYGQATRRWGYAPWRLGKPDALLHHSDQGSKYTSERFQLLMADNSVTRPMS